MEGLQMNMKLLAIVLFVITYVLLLAFPSKKSYVALGSALIFVAVGIVPFGEVFTVIDWNVILMIAGTMGIVSLFIESRMPSALGDWIVERTPNLKWVILLLSIIAGLISAFVDNVATVLIIVPLAINLFKRLNIPVVPSAIISISLASNLQGAATMVGDTTSIMLAGQTGMNFLDFFVYQGRIGMFWIVQVSAIATSIVLFFLLKKYNRPLKIATEKEVIKDFFPTYLLVALVGLLIAASFIPDDSKPAITNGLICVTLMIIGLIHEMVTKHGLQDIKDNLIEIDLHTLMLLAGLFVVVGGIVRAGVIDDISNFFLQVGGDNLFLIYSLIVWFSVLISAFVDNIPYVATMLPVIATLSEALGLPTPLLYFALLSGATLGGNLTPIGASANITALGLLRKEGCNVSVKEFMKMSIPYTLTAVLVGYVLIWFIWR
jgi:Na+/H+ antiporter NhaD/arsenite permease-like protein